MQPCVAGHAAHQSHARPGSWRGEYHIDVHPGARQATVRWPRPPVSPQAARTGGQRLRVKDTSTRPVPTHARSRTAPGSTTTREAARPPTRLEHFFHYDSGPGSRVCHEAFDRR